MNAAVPPRRAFRRAVPRFALVRAARRPGRPRRRGRGLLVGTAASAVLLLVAFPAQVRAADALPTPASTPSAAPGYTGPTPHPQPGPSPAPPGQSPSPAPSPASPEGTPPASSGTGTSSPRPCAAGGQDCVPPPAVPPPPTPHTTPPAPDTGGTGGGGIVGWVTRGITGAINGFFRGLVTAAFNPLLDLLGRTLLTTPTPSQLPAIGQLWSTSWGISVAAYSILIMLGGITVMSFGSVQTRTSIKEIAPRIPIGFLAAALSQVLAGTAIELANPLPAAILGHGVDPNAASVQLRNIILGALAPTPGNVDTSIFLIFLGLFLAGAVVALLCTYIARVTMTVALIGAAPLALAGHALPQTEKLAFWWWRAFFACLGIQIAQSFVLIASFEVFFTPGGFTVFSPTPDGVVNLLAAITLIYFLFKIPFWMMPRIGHGSSILGRIVRAYVMGRALGLLGGRFGRGAGTRAGRGHGGPGGRGGRGGGPGGRPGQSYSSGILGEGTQPRFSLRDRKPITFRGQHPANPAPLRANLGQG
ncbi:hypothetical protein [Frankia sp. CiP3]|uniref:hypothetical protein n=1 Tax=Frankia sp. CiP3 TaxID=2880971 RepID=UPI002104DA20|nr:hypothetical protein [Frankia sp. CiP3]